MKFRKYSTGDKYLFQLLSESGAVLLQSEEYESSSARNNGIRSVSENVNNPDRYISIEEEGKFYYILRAANNQEIGRSVAYGTPVLREENKQALIADDGGEAYGTDGRTDDYKPLFFYEVNGEDTENGFDAFSAEGEHYFSYLLDGTIYLISEGYTTSTSRDNGISSVERNLPIRERYREVQHPNGKYYFNLRAGNNQEIATSRWFDSEDDMRRIINRLTGTEVGTGRMAAVSIDAPPPPAEPTAKKKRKKRKTEKKPKAEKVYLNQGEYPYNDVTYQLFRSGNDKHYFTFKNTAGKTILLNSDVRGFDTPAGAQAKLDQVIKYGPHESNYEGKMTRNGKYYFYLKNDEGKNIAKSFFYNTEEEMQAAIGGLLGDGTLSDIGSTMQSNLSNASLDDYLPLAAYEANMSLKSNVDDDFIAFEKEGEYYFAWVNDGRVLMRSEGYKTAKARDNGIHSVIKNREIEKRYSTVQAEGGYCTTLKAGNNQEIARSGPHDDESAAIAWYRNKLTSGIATAGLGALAAKGLSTSKADKNDLEKVENRAEKQIKAEANTSSDLLKNDASDYSENKGNNAGTPLTSATSTLAANKAADGPSSKSITTGSGTSQAERLATSGGNISTAGSKKFSWWWLLPLLLLALLWLVLRGCGTDKTSNKSSQGVEATAPTPTSPKTVDVSRGKQESSSSTADNATNDDAAALATKATAEKAAKEKVAEEEAEKLARLKAERLAADRKVQNAPLATANANSCSCPNSRAKIFTLPAGATPKNITKLGSLPEFGNSHGLSAKQFYEKLSDRYQNDVDHQAYLDYLFRSMGYTDGFADAATSQFKEVELPRGTIGLLGFGEYHGYAYSQLNTSQHDRQAFRIRAANGCDVHFMKTCGNYMYVCQ